MIPKIIVNMLDFSKRNKSSNSNLVSMIQRSEHLSGPSNMTSISLAPVVPSQDFRVVRVAYKIQSSILKGKVACFANGPSISVFHLIVCS